MIDYQEENEQASRYVRSTDGASIPNDLGNRDYVEMLDLVVAGEAQILAWVPPSAEQEQQAEQAAYEAAATADSQLYTTLSLIVGNMDMATVTPEQAAILAPYYEEWRAGVDYVISDLNRYDGKVYQCVQSHTSQVGWEPPAVPALWSVYVDPEAPPVAWVQPTGAQDAYRAGAEVLHVGFTWQSLVASNVWEPGVYGWEQV